ncbi:hypothetical protein EAO71_26965 [Streptomyces sp. ms191]|uniref:hypothetical protein n=1 Tax=Streptomyces sp. ms191 TaxID=1827978 RepID=UPI0011CD5DB9|nr:hypothetical protein [Streptomyces sp. ms191]TXS21748.1 hypothetical protein EAO71_26965 [Streptomyces sp. ms191]
MSILTTVLIIAAVLVVLLAAGVLLRARMGPSGGTRSLKRRFGPEYDRTLARHGGDGEAADRDLRERTERYGHLKPLPLEPAVREQYTAQWTTLQERFVDAPRQAVADAGALIGRVAATRGFPDADRPEEQLDALSVHHPRQVEGLRTARRGADSESASTEELREALVHARALFDHLTTAESATVATARPHGTSGHRRGHLLKPKGSGA